MGLENNAYIHTYNEDTKQDIGKSDTYNILGLNVAQHQKKKNTTMFIIFHLLTSKTKLNNF